MLVMPSDHASIANRGQSRKKFTFRTANSRRYQPFGALECLQTKFSFRKGLKIPIKRYGAEKAGAGGQNLPFARAVEAGGFLFVSGQVAMKDGEIQGVGIVEQTHLTIQNLIAILQEADYGLEHVVRCGVWLDDPRDFWSFNAVYKSYFGDNPPARAAVQSHMMVDCKVEIECVAYKDPA